MKINRINKLKVGGLTFRIKWYEKKHGGCFSYGDKSISIGVRDKTDEQILEIICHELMEIVAIEFHVRLARPDCDSDYLFVYDHRQHDSMMNMFSGLLSQFIK